MSRVKVIFMSAVAALLIYGSVANAEAVTATLMNVEGDVQVQEEEGAKWRDARDGVRLSDGSSIKTGDDGQAVIAWGLGNVVRVYPLSKVSVEELVSEPDTSDSSSDLSLGHGRVMAQVGKLTSKNSSFNIKTPTAVAGVRGTAFDLDMPEGSDELSVLVLEGSVSLEAGGMEIMLDAGFESIVVAGEIPSVPMAIPAADLADLKQEAGELKKISEQTGGGDGKGGTKEGKRGKKSKTEGATDAVTEAITIQNQSLGIIDTTGCPAGGGCIEGEIRVTP
ncbi:MAG: FecR family protein [bacterium]